MRSHNLATIVPGLAFLFWCAEASAVPIPDGDYYLHNHPGGLQIPPSYGLRLDALNGDDTNVFTFDFDHVDGARAAQVMMTVDSFRTEIRIEGDIYGGLNDPADTTQYASELSGQVGWWHLSFIYDTAVRLADGDDDYVAGPDPASLEGANIGTLTRIDGFGANSPLAEVYQLWEFPPFYDWTFRLGDEDDDLGHRGFSGISGWGWLLHAPAGTGPNAGGDAVKDWLFTAEPMPLPGTGILSLVGVGVVGLVRRRRK